MMINRGSRPKSSSAGKMLRRLDRIAADLNVVLVVIAIGLATLDFTFFVAQRAVASLPITQADFEPGSPPAK